jgi:hypothetical protein
MNRDSIHLKPGQTTFQFSFGSHFPTYTITNPEMILAPGVYPVKTSDDRMATITWAPHLCLTEHAAQFWTWIKSRGGVAFWQSQAIEAMGRTVQTPVNNEDGTGKAKPHWQYAESPIRIVTDPDEIVVVVAKSQGMWPCKRDGELTRASKTKFDRLNPHSYWVPGHDGKAEVFAAEHMVPLRDFIVRSKPVVFYYDWSDAPRAFAQGEWDNLEVVEARGLEELDAYIAERAKVGETFTRDRFKKKVEASFVLPAGEAGRYTPRR